jgi:hypothetical protein
MSKNEVEYTILDELKLNKRINIVEHQYPSISLKIIITIKRVDLS